jgi:hypothetical protein
LFQRIEGVAKSSGKRKTFTIWAKANVSGKFMSIEGTQVFGTGGSPSAEVTTISVQKVALTTQWAKYSFILDFPSVAGKTIGTNGDDHYRVGTWFSGGPDNNPRTDNLGLQTGVFDVAHISLVDGDATAEDDPFPFVPPEIEEIRCKRYFERIGGGSATATLGSGFTDTTTLARGTFPMAIGKRVSPTLSSVGSCSIGVPGTDQQGAISFPGTAGISVQFLVTTASAVLVSGQGCIFYLSSSGNNYIDIDAEINV